MTYAHYQLTDNYQLRREIGGGLYDLTLGMQEPYYSFS